MYIDIFQSLSGLFIGGIAGFLGAVVGAGGLVSIPLLIFLGLPPHFFGLLYAAALGAGAGAVIFIVLVEFFGLTIIEANATDLPAWFALVLITIVIFSIKGLVIYSVGVPMLIGGYIGGRLGADMAIHKGEAWVKAVFMLLVIVFAIKLLFF